MGRWFKRKGKAKQGASNDSVYVLADDRSYGVSVVPMNDAKSTPASPLSHEESTTQQARTSQRNDDVDQMECLAEPDLHWKHRVAGSCGCALLGTLISSNSFRQMAEYASNAQVANVIQATLGNLIVVCSSCFWTGPKQQCQNMWRETSRRVSLFLYGGSIVTTLTLALVQPPLVSLYYFILMIVQYVSVVVYALSYVPCCKNRMNNYLKRKTSQGNTSSGMAGAKEQTSEGIMA